MTPSSKTPPGREGPRPPSAARRKLGYRSRQGDLPPAPKTPLLPVQQRLILGQNCVREAIRRWGSEIDRIYVEHDHGPRVAALVQFALDHGISVEETTRSELDRLAGGSLHQGVAASAPALEFVEWPALRERPGLLAIALDGIVDPQNFGAVIRSAVGIASAPVIWAESSSAPLTPATFRASAGAIEHAELCQVRSLHGTLADAVAHGFRVVGLAPDGDTVLQELDATGPVIVVLGSEQKGMARAVRRSCSDLVRLHQAGTIQSLNASVAAGIALHHLAWSRLGR